MEPKAVGALLVLVWSSARIYYWKRASGRVVVAQRDTVLRRVLLGITTLSLAPIYLYYFTSTLDRLGWAGPVWLQWTGDVLLGSAVALFIWSHSALGSSWTAKVNVASQQQLVVTGPYRWVRHPMYASLMLMALGLLLATLNLAVALPFGAAVTLVYIERVNDEERLMVETFGDEYVDYQRESGRLLPTREALRRRHPA